MLGGQATGLPLEYLLPTSTRPSEQQFYNLQAEETLSSLEATELSPPQASSTAHLDETNSKPRNLTLNLEPSEQRQNSGIIFSPGGNDAYVFGATEKKTPRGERPKTVGHADDAPRPTRIDRSALQGRLETLRASLDFDMDEESSAQPSSEPSPRRYLPRVPTTDEDIESFPSPSVTRRGGALSPSIASVASGSTVASGTDPRRRNLEWDSGADLGYFEEIVRPKEAAATLSTLDKLVIGNYSNFLRTEPEGKSTVKGNLRSNQQFLNRLPGGQDHEEDLRQMRLHKFADSLLKQRQYAQQSSKKSENAVQSQPETAKTNLATNRKAKSDNSQDGSPSRRKMRKKSSAARRRSSSLRSSSLTDLASFHNLRQLDRLSGAQSVTDLSPRSQTDTSSSTKSSNATVVPHLEIEDEIDPRILEALSTDPASLPVDIYKVLGRGGQGGPPSSTDSRQFQQSQTSLNSRQSVETVVTLEQLVSARQQQKSMRKPSSRMTESDSLDTDDEIQMIRDRNDAEGSEEREHNAAPGTARSINNWFTDDSNRAQSLPPLPKKESKKVTKSRPMQDTASEDERQKEAKRSGTLDSAPIDRAKSFEYFPGESFPLQENSSSYEYLPGHMIHDTRPPTVVSNRPEGGSSSSNVSPTTSPSIHSTSSDLSKVAKKRSSGKIDSAKLAYHLMEKWNKLQSAHVHQTMTFYSRLKDHISYISTPSQSLADSRLKQQMADRILDLMRQEEVKLGDKRPVSSQLRNSESLATVEASTKKIDEVDNNDNDDNTSKNDHDFSTMRSLLLESRSDLTLQKMKISQFKRIRHEIRKLEKLEKMRLKKAIENPSSSSKVMTEADVLKQIMDNMSLDDSTSCVSNSRTSTIASEVDTGNLKKSRGGRSSSRQKEAIKDYSHRGIEGQSASGSDNKKSSAKKKPSVSTVKEFCANKTSARSANSASAATAQAQISSKKDGKTNTYNSSSLSSCGAGTQHKSLSSAQVVVVRGKNSIADFGQTFPTPRELPSAEEKKAAIHHRSNKKQQMKPLSYDLPPPAPKNAKRRPKTVDGNKENANCTANEGSSEKINDMSLQEALFTRKPDFIERSSLRVDVLRNLKSYRILHAEKYKVWLDEVAKIPPKSRVHLRPPEMPRKPPRLFSHNQMVKETRAKYQRLPEIVYSRSEAKRKSSYKTNRLKAEMYKKKLQRKVLQGHVSLAYHNQILQQ